MKKVVYIGGWGEFNPEVISMEGATLEGVGVVLKPVKF